MSPLFNTLIERFYVFLFLIAYLILSWRTRGLKVTLIFLIVGYLIAWASEVLSIRFGFPYGWYAYIYENLKGEWLNLGVPVWDSLSYVFLCFASLSVAKFVLGGQFAVLRLTLLSALFVTFLDLVIDPLADRGDQWFLGKIYFYPEPGFYFGVPVSNFVGWFGVSSLIVGSSLLVERRLKQNQTIRRIDPYWGVFFYFGIFLFNWFITLWIGEIKLAVVDLLWMGIPFILIWKQHIDLKQKMG